MPASKGPTGRAAAGGNSPEMATPSSATEPPSRSGLAHSWAFRHQGYRKGFRSGKVKPNVRMIFDDNVEQVME